MGRMLVLGGTGWLGSAVVRAGLVAGHDVTAVSRGRSGIVPPGAAHVVADRDRRDAIVPVIREGWDAVVDLADDPEHVMVSTTSAGAIGRYVFVSTVSVYADQSVPDESARRVPAAAPGYPGDKATCEDLVLDVLGDRAVITRAGLLGGPGDPSGRTTYWVRRFARAAAAGQRPVVVPEVPDHPVSVLDVEDLAAWLVLRAAGGATGVFDVTGPVVPFGEYLGAARAVAGHTGSLVPIAQAELRSAGVAEWAGPRSLPLWIADPAARGMNTRPSERAVAAGLVRRPVGDTLARILRAEEGAIGSPPGTGPFPGRSGLTDAEEAALRELRSSGRVPLVADPEDSRTAPTRRR